MLIHELLDTTLDTCDVYYLFDITRITELTTQLHPIPKGRAVCLPYNYMPDIGNPPHLLEPSVGRIATATHGTHGAWLPNPNFNDTTVLASLPCIHLKFQST